MCPAPASSDNTYQELYAEEALRGEQGACAMRWVILALVSLIMLTMLSLGRYPAAAWRGLGLAAFGACYNFWLWRRLRQGLLSTRISYLFVSLDLFTLTAYTYLASVHVSPLAVISSTTIPIYGMIMLLVALRQDRRLLLFAVGMTVACLGGVYWLRYPYLDKTLLGFHTSADPMGVIFKCVYMLAFGLCLLFIPKTISRLLDRQAQLFKAQRLREETYRATLEQQVAVRTNELERANRELQTALDEVKALSGLLPICTSCKKIRDDQGYWRGVEDYIRRHSQADFTHGICPDCMARIYPEVYARLKDRLDQPGLPITPTQDPSFKKDKPQ